MYSSAGSSDGVFKLKAPTYLICSSSNRRIGMFCILSVIKGEKKFISPFSLCLVVNGSPSEAFPLIVAQKKSTF